MCVCVFPHADKIYGGGFHQSSQLSVTFALLGTYSVYKHLEINDGPLRAKCISATGDNICVNINNINSFQVATIPLQFELIEATLCRGSGVQDCIW